MQPVQLPMMQMQALYCPGQTYTIAEEQPQPSSKRGSKRSAKVMSHGQNSAEAVVSNATSNASLANREDDVDSIRGRVWTLSQDAGGCRKVQDLIEDCTDGEQEEIAAELQGHVWQALVCPHANHVLQKCIMSMRPQTCQFIIDELIMEKKVASGAQLKYGCRVIQRLLEHCREDQVHEICENLLASGIELSGHHFGSYVMQHLAEYGTRDQKRRLLELFQKHSKMSDYGGFTCGVIAKALEHASTEDARAFALKCVRMDGLLVRISRNRQGHLVAKTVLELLGDQVLERSSAVAQIVRAKDSLQESRYGRAVLNACQQLCLKEDSSKPSL